MMFQVSQLLGTTPNTRGMFINCIMAASGFEKQRVDNVKESTTDSNWTLITNIAILNRSRQGTTHGI